MTETELRREILLHGLDEVVDECRRLVESGYTQHGNWTLGQICRHLTLTIDANVDGYPSWMIALGFPLRPFLRVFMLPRLLRGQSPSGVRTAPIYVPPSGLEDDAEVAALQQSIQRYRDHREQLRPHPGFGRLTPDMFDRFHAAHASHHLSFLESRAK